MLSEHLEMKKCEVHHAPGDADLLIVQKAVESATTLKTVLVGDDTDLLILLCYHASLDCHHIYFRPEPKKGTKNPLSVGHHSCQETARLRDMHAHPLPTCTSWM